MNTKVDEGKLISGKEAFNAAMDGKEVLWKHIDHEDWLKWTRHTPWCVDTLEKGLHQFKLKPKTIMINGIEVPSCGENYKEGEEIYVFDDCCDERGYIKYSASGHQYQDSIPKLWWRTEEEIKQVVAALRQVFGGSHDN